MRSVILHYHIFKNAGSTIEEILDHSFGERFTKLETPTGEGLISNSELVKFLDERPNLRAFSSHQIRHPVPTVRGYLFFDFCFLRDPIDRIRSIYVYFRQKPNPADPISLLANRTDLGDFIAGMIQDFPLFVKNVQVNLLACGGDSDEPETRDLELAVERMLATSFLGVLDCFEQSTQTGSKALRSAFPELDCNRAPVNVSDGLVGTVASRTEKLREACRKDVFEELLHLNALDRRLVDRTRAEVMRRAHAGGQPGALRVQPEGSHPPRPAAARVTARRFFALAPYWREIIGKGRQALFDREYYRSAAPHETFSRLWPLPHFLLRGAYQGRRPHPLFDPAFYRRKYPDVAAAEVNPLCHYLKHGGRELRQPHPLFDAVFYLNHNPDVRRSGVNPLVHYVLHGAAEDRKPARLFDPGHYRYRCPEAPRGGRELLRHFLESGAGAASPHPLFDCQAYRGAHHDLTGNPLVHYLLSSGGQDPHCEASVVAPAAVAVLAIGDIEIAVICLDASFESKTWEERLALYAAWKRWAWGRYSVALVWPDACGLPQWLAEAQQEPFLRSLRIDQVLAQTSSVPDL
jgi:Sulfotransferase family